MKNLTEDYIRRAEEKGFMIFQRADAGEKYLVIPPHTTPKNWELDLSADAAAKIIDGADSDE